MIELEMRHLSDRIVSLIRLLSCLLLRQQQGHRSKNEQRLNIKHSIIFIIEFNITNQMNIRDKKNECRMSADINYIFIRNKM